MLFVVIFLIIAGIMIVQYWWLFLIIGALVAGIILLCVAVTKTTCPLCGNRFAKMANRRCPKCDNIDFNNIAFCKIEDSDVVYRHETETEPEIYYYDDAPHVIYNETVHAIPKGMEYTFLIVYGNGKKSEFRKYRDSHPLCKPLLEKTGIVFETESPTAKTGDFTN